MKSTSWANIVTVRKMLELMEEKNKTQKAGSKLALSAMGLERFAKETNMQGWSSGKSPFLCFVTS